MSDHYGILLRPVLSEKGHFLFAENKYTFAVAPDANKFQIKAAVEAEFRVDVLDVRVVSVKPKEKRRGRRQKGTVPGWRKAIVTVAPGQKIDGIYEAV
jgi:large subunit ribosomal protein L23